jgi:restriction endonuclease S subunit
MTFGNTSSRTVLEGGSTRFNINGIEKMNLSVSGLAITNDILINGLSVSNAVNQILRTVTVTNGTYTASSTNDYIRASNNVIITLPAATASGKRMYIKNFGSGTVTINNTTTNLIDGQVNQLMSPKSAIIVIDGKVGMWDIL